MMSIILVWENRCRWSADSSQELVYVKYRRSFLNLLDVNKGIFALKDPVRLEREEKSNFQSIYTKFSQFR